MDSEAPIGENRRGSSRRRRILLILLALPFLGLLLAYFILAGGITGRWIAAKIQTRTGLEARVGGATWSPWNGVSINAVEMLQPTPLRAAVQDPLLRIDSIRLAPVWRAWLRGRLEVSSITLDTARVVLPVELISELARQAASAQPAPSPPVVAAQPPAVAVQPVPPTPPVPPAGPPPTAPVPKPPAPPPAPTGWLHLKNTSLVVVHAGSHRALLEVSKTSGSIPITGDAAQSVLKIGRVAALGRELAANLAADLDWTAPMLSLKPVNLEINGYKYVVAGKIAQAKGLPLLIEAQLPRQPLAAFPLPFDGQASAEAIAANARFRGLLLAPGTWQGDLLAEALTPSLRVAAHETKFDKGSAVTVLRGGVLSCVDARLIGDDLSLLGNATLLADGRAAGAARLVAAPET
ncbi:MAG: hypothetical protein RLZZ214_3918, partial [Verrucomicrobiota bacterium]